jgi:hypothetical protein
MPVTLTGRAFPLDLASASASHTPLLFRARRLGPRGTRALPFLSGADRSTASGERSLSQVTEGAI